MNGRTSFQLYEDLIENATMALHWLICVLK